MQNEDKILRLWRKRGPIGKLHNIATFITRTPRRRMTFKNLQDNNSLIMIVRDNDTRWNSVYLMLQSATRLQSTIDRYVFNESELESDRLSMEDWKIIIEISKFLETFYNVTIRLQSNKCQLAEVLTSIDYLLGKYEEAKEIYKDGPLAASVDLGWSKLNKWYAATERAPIYIAAVVLDPRLKWEYFEDAAEWPEEWINIAKRKMERLWIVEYRGGMTSLPGVMSDHESMNEIDKFRFGKRKRISTRDEYAVYLQSPCDTSITDIRAWWISHKFDFPELSVMALDVLAIPPTSAEVERLFSSAGQLIMVRRNRLKDTTIEAVECIKNWNKNGIIKVDIGNDDVPDDM